MKLFKKFLLAAGLVGLVGSLGFADKAWAKTYYQSAKISTNISDDGILTWDIDLSEKPEDMTEEDVFVKLDTNTITKAVITVNGKSKTIKADDADAPDDMSVGGVDIGSDLKLDTPASAQSPSSIGGTVKVKLTFVVEDDDEKSFESTEDTSTLKYKQIITSSDFNKGYISAEGVMSEAAPIYLYKAVNESFFISAFPKDGYKSIGWSGSASSSEESLNVTAKPNAMFRAEFAEKEVPPTGISLWARVGTGAKQTQSITVDVGDTVSLGIDPIPSNATLDNNVTWYIDGTAQKDADKTTAKLGIDSGMAGKTKVVRAEYKGLSSQEIRIIVNSSVIKVTTSDFVEYITDGYTLEFKAKAENGSQNIAFAAASDFKDYIDGTPEISKNSDSDKTVTVKVKFKEKLDKGNSNKEIKLTATVDGKTAKIDSDTDTDTTKKVTIYSRPTASISTSDRKLTYKVPSKVNTGNTDGKESDGDEKDNTLTKISEVKGVKLRVYNGDTSLGFTQTAKSSGTSSTIDASTMESLVINLSSKFSGESATAKFRVYPNDSDGKYNKNVYADSSVTVYRAVISWTDDAGKTGTVNVYGFEGQTIDAATVEKVDQTLKGKNLRLTDADGKTITSFKMGTSASVNDHKAVLGARESAADDTGLDRVPRTGQNNALVYVMVAIVACAVCGGLYAYNKKSKNL